MIQLNPKQVEWLVYNQPETEYLLEDWSGITTEGYLYEDDIKYSKKGQLKYYLTPETYNSLPTEFKQLAD
jgi:hypothetical protein